jgi:hypothetical protein
MPGFRGWLEELLAGPGPTLAERFPQMHWWFHNRAPARRPGESARDYRRRLHEDWRRFAGRYDLSRRTGRPNLRPGFNYPRHGPGGMEEWLRQREMHIRGRRQRRRGGGGRQGRRGAGKYGLEKFRPQMR